MARESTFGKAALLLDERNAEVWSAGDRPYQGVVFWPIPAP